MNKATTEPAYNYKVVRQFAIMTVVWGVIGMGLGVLIASQLVWPQMNFDLPWTSFGPECVKTLSYLACFSPLLLCVAISRLFTTISAGNASERV